VVTSAVNTISADDAASSGYAIGSAIATASADGIDERTGGAFKQVPGEVEVTLDPEPTPPVPPR